MLSSTALFFLCCAIWTSLGNINNRFRWNFPFYYGEHTVQVPKNICQAQAHFLYFFIVCPIDPGSRDDSQFWEVVLNSCLGVKVR